MTGGQSPDAVQAASSFEELAPKGLFVPAPNLENMPPYWRSFKCDSFASLDKGLYSSSHASDARAELEQVLAQYGCLVLRGSADAGPERLLGLIDATSSGAMAYTERTSPRIQVGRGIYTSTEYAADQEIFLHNEHSYAWTHPTRLYFHCVEPARLGGVTPVADCRRVLARLSSATRAKFERLGWTYVRNFGGNLGLDWTECFRTQDRASVERYCDAHHIDYEWRPGGRLRTRQVRPATTVHLRSGAETWFNHVAFFHVTTLPRDIADVLISTFAERDLPNNTYYGDGTPISSDVLDEIRAAYLAERIGFQWRRGDTLILDNLLTAHGRTPFRGERMVLVGMAEPRSLS